MVMKLTPSLEETTVLGMDIKLCAFATSHFDILDGLKYHR